MADIAYRHDGNSESVPLEQVFTAERVAALGLPEGTVLTSQNVTEQQVKTALAQHLDVNANEFADSFVELNPNGNITVRPNTTFGA